MIERIPRNQYAQLLRNFLAGKTDNFQYEDLFAQLEFESDEGINQIFCDVWHYYCDFRRHKLNEQGGGFESGENKQAIIRFILFLHSEFEYEWPITSLKESLFKLLTLRAYSHRGGNQAQEKGDKLVWPFYRRKDYDYALANPRLLNENRI